MGTAMSAMLRCTQWLVPVEKERKFIRTRGGISPPTGRGQWGIWYCVPLRNRGNRHSNSEVAAIGQQFWRRARVSPRAQSGRHNQREASRFVDSACLFDDSSVRRSFRSVAAYAARRIIRCGRRRPG